MKENFQIQRLPSSHSFIENNANYTEYFLNFCSFCHKNSKNILKSEDYYMEYSLADKRLLEIVFYLLCRKIFSINKKQNDILEFIQGYRWTNLFDYDILRQAIIEKKLLLEPTLAPKRQEVVAILEHPDARIRITRHLYLELTRDTELYMSPTSYAHYQAKEEVYPTEIRPRLNINDIHATIHSFLIALNSVAMYTRNIKL